MATLSMAERRVLNRDKAEQQMEIEIVESVMAALAKATGQRADLAGARAKTSQALASEALKAIARVEQAAAAGTGAAHIKGMVALQELAVQNPIDFAKAAYVKDPALLNKVLMEAPAVAGKETAPAIRRKAWETFLNLYPASAGNLLGSYDEMVNLYGPAESAGLDVSNPAMMRRLDTLTTKLNTERKAAEDWRVRHNAFINAGKTFNQWATERGIDPENAPDAAYEKYAADTGLDFNVPPGYLSKQIPYFKSLVNTEFTSDITEDIAKQDEYIEFFQSWLDRLSGSEGQGAGAESWSDRDILAAWLEKSQTQDWAARNGLKVGRVLPLTDELKKQIEEGKYPGHVFVKSGIYVPGADDEKAFRMAERQLRREPSRNIGRALGLTLGSQAAIEIDMKRPASKRAVKGYPYAKGGIVVELADGTLYQQADGSQDWKPLLELPADAGEAMPVDDEMSPLPAVKTFKGAYRKPRAGDPEGSYRFVDAATGREELIVPEDIAAVRTSKELGDLKPRPLDAVRKAQAERVLAKNTPPPLPESAKPAPAAPPPVPPVEPIPAPPPLPKSPDQPPPFTDKQKQDMAMQKADAALEMTRPPRPKRVIPEVPVTTSPETVKRAFRRPVDERDTYPR